MAIRLCRFCLTRYDAVWEIYGSSVGENARIRRYMMGRRRTIIKDEPEDQAGNEDIRSALAQIDDTDGWVAEAWRLGVDSIRLHHRTGKSVPQLTELTKDLQEGIEDWAEDHFPPRRTPDGERLVRRYILIAIKGRRACARTEFSRGDIESEPWVVAPEKDLDIDAELAKSIKQTRVESWQRSTAGRGGLDAVKTVVEALKGNSGEVAAVMGPMMQVMASQASASQVRADQAMAALIARLDKRESPGIGAQLLTMVAPALPGVVEMVADRFLGGGTVVSDASEVGKLDAWSWIKLQLHNILQGNPQIVPAILGKLAGMPTGQVAQLAPAGVSPQAEEPTMNGDPKMRKVRDYVIGRMTVAGAAKTEEERIPVLRSMVAFLMSLDPQGSIGLQGLLNALPDMDLEAASLRLTFFDERFADPAMKPGIEALIAYLDSIEEEVEPPQPPPA